MPQVEAKRAVRPSAADLQLLDSHPVIRNQAYLPTEPIKLAYTEISETVAERDPGVSFVAHSRFGKTFAISVLSDQLAQAFPNVPILCANANGHSRFTEWIFYAELLEGCMRGPIAQGKPTALRNKLFRFLWTLAASKGSDRIVLFVDEAQNWSEPELSALRDLSNDLALLAKVLLIVNLFGAPALANTRTALLQAGRTDLVGRFMIRQYEFPGVGSQKSLATIAGYYDDPRVSEFPAGSGVSYSEFFMPLAYRDGWRLKKEAPVLWKCYQKVARSHGGVKQIGMKWIASTIRRFLTDCSQQDQVGFRSDPAIWENAIIRSGFALTLGVTYSADAELGATAMLPAEEDEDEASDP
jgi:hypothetical protein